MSRHFAMIAVLLMLVPTVASADEPKKLSGRVLDQAGEPAVGAVVAANWGANGLSWEQVLVVRAKEPDKLWDNEGKMEPWGRGHAVTDAEGRFSIPAPERMRTLLIYDRDRRQGALVEFDPKHPEVPIEARLAPLIRIFGKNRLSGSDQPLKWGMTHLNFPEVESDPLNFNRMALCGSFQSRFEFQVPPGTYQLDASTDEPHAATLEDRTITVTADQKEIDLGTLVLRRRLSFQERVDQAKANGTWGNYKENFGKEPPPWHLTDAKGIAKDAKLSDFKGKWALVYLWSPGCVPCLKRELPELMAFYETHKAQRDRFEILAFCSDQSETLQDIPALERHLASVKKAVWGGKDLPFPVLLDNTFQTYERFGLEGNGVSNHLLINPEGKLVEGGLKGLEEALGRP
jgi:AhpC/TSA family